MEKKLSLFILMINTTCMLILLLACDGRCDQVISDEQLLLRNLFDNKDPWLLNTLPKNRTRDHGPLEIRFKMVVYHIYSVRATEEEIDLAAWIVMRWQNDVLRWNQSEYNISLLLVSPERIWMPKMFVSQNVGSSIIQAPSNANVAVEPNGQTTVDFISKMRIRCNMEACLFPSDSHHCQIPFQLIGYSKDEAVFSKNLTMHTHVESVEETGTWYMNLASIFTGHRQMPHLNTITSFIDFDFKIVRRSRIFIVTLIIPIVILTSVAFASVMLPPNSGERVSLLVTCLLAQVVYLDTIFDTLPKSSDYTPVFVSWILAGLIYVCAQTWLSCIASSWSSQGESGQRLSKSSKTIVFGFMAKFLASPCVNKVKDKVRISKPRSSVSTAAATDEEMTQTIGVGEITQRTDSSTEAEQPFANEEKLKECDLCKLECQHAVALLDRFSMVLSAIFVSVSVAIAILVYSEKARILCFSQ